MSRAMNIYENMPNVNEQHPFRVEHFLNNNNNNNTIQREQESAKQTAPTVRVYKRRSRTKFNKRQLDILDAAFLRTHYPDVNVIDKLANILDLSTERISIWFQNRRARFKKLKLNDKQSGLIVTNDSPDASESINSFLNNQQHNLPFQDETKIESNSNEIEYKLERSEQPNEDYKSHQLVSNYQYEATSNESNENTEKNEIKQQSEYQKYQQNINSEFYYIKKY
jgi:hypothetical protein